EVVGAGRLQRARRADPDERVVEPVRKLPDGAAPSTTEDAGDRVAERAHVDPAEAAGDGEAREALEALPLDGIRPPLHRLEEVAVGKICLGAGLDPLHGAPRRGPLVA